MTDEQVKAFLEKYGPQEARTLASHFGSGPLRGRITAARRTLKRIGAFSRMFGDWPTYRPDGSRWDRWDYQYRSPNFPTAKFELWSLKPWAR